MVFNRWVVDEKAIINFSLTNWRRRYIIVVGTYSLFCLKRQPPFYWARYFKANSHGGECRTSVWINLPCLLISKAISHKGPLVKIPMTNFHWIRCFVQAAYFRSCLEIWHFATGCVIHPSFYNHYISFHYTIHHTSFITSNISKNERVWNHNMWRKLNGHITPLHLQRTRIKTSHTFFIHSALCPSVIENYFLLLSTISLYREQKEIISEGKCLTGESFKHGILFQQYFLKQF